VIARPTPDELHAAAAAAHFSLSDDEVPAYAAAIERTLADLERVEQLADSRVADGPARRAGRAPAAEENALGGWAWISDIPPTGDGRLAGRRIAVKDVVAVAGQPLFNGSPVMAGHVSDADATVVTRILEAGGTIAGKAMCEAFCISGGSHTSYPQPARNPHDPSRWAGGSSSGCAVLIASGAVDMAVGCDQGGSIREPSSWSGVVGLKPTYGLVPYTGIASMDYTLDHAGPMAASVHDAALLLDAIAGPDGVDGRQAGVEPPPDGFVSALTGDCAGLRVGVVREGFAWPDASEPQVDEAVRAAAERLALLGAEVDEVSVPLHRDGARIFAAVVAEGVWTTMFCHEGQGRGGPGRLDVAMSEFYARARRESGDLLAPHVKLAALLGHHLVRGCGGRHYALGHNLRPVLRAAYDDALTRADILLMPTTPQRATLFDPARSLADDLFLSANMIQNTCPFNLTGHPALSVPCGPAGELPMGMTLIGRHGADATLLRAADAFERAARLAGASA
jgi:amidase